MSGWVPMYRAMYDPGHWLAPTKRDPSNRRDAWCDMIQMATRVPREGRYATLGVGEFVASVRTLARRWGWSKSRVLRFVCELEARTAIETVSETPAGTVYRIVNYRTYAIDRDSERDTSRDSERDRSGTAARQEQQVTGNKTSSPTSKKSRKRSKSETQLPSSWQPTPEHVERAGRVGLDIETEAESFRANAEAKGRTAINWNAAFTTWLINAEKWGRRDGTLRASKNGKHADPLSPVRFYD